MGEQSSKPVPLVFGEGDMGAGEYPRIYERNINVKVVDTGGPQFRVHASLFDLEHNFHAELLVDIESGRIDEAVAAMAKRPYQSYCPRALENVGKMKGQVIGRGITRKVVEILGRSQGCVHLVEVFQAAIGFTATILIGRRSGLMEDTVVTEEEHRQKWLPILKNTCQVFREEREEELAGEKRKG